MPAPASIAAQRSASAQRSACVVPSHAHTGVVPQSTSARTAQTPAERQPATQTSPSPQGKNASQRTGQSGRARQSVSQQSP
jgi:hypothetical protein